MLRTLLCCLLVFAAACARADGRLDTAFGVEGFAVEGFQPDAAGGESADADVGIVACAGPGGRLVASGVASRLTRVVTMFLTPSGQLDAAVGFGGKQSVPLPAGRKENVVGACQADGKPVMVFNLARSDDTDAPHHELHVLRLDAATGLPDPGFGTGGFLRIDLDTAFNLFTTSQRPWGVFVLPAGDLAIVGSLQVARPSPQSKIDTVYDEHGFVLRVTADGQLAQRATSRDFLGIAKRYVGGGLAEGGDRLYVVGSDSAKLRDDGNLVLERFSWPGLQIQATSLDPVSPPMRPFGARITPGGRIAVAASISGAPVAVLTDFESARQRIPLPVPRIDGESAAVFNAQVAIVGPHLVYAASVARGNYPEGFYAARLVAMADGERVDARFGHGGSVLVRPAPVGDCQPAPLHAFARFTFWNGAVTAIGALDRGCTTADPDYDYAVLRLDASLFSDGMETRYTVR